MKKIIISVLVFFALVSVHLTLRYTINEFYISKSNKGYYDSKIVNKLFYLNWPQRYIAYYNRGNNEYNLGEYNKAIDDYEEALKSVPKKRECKVRNNLALSHIKLLDLDADDAISKINSIQKILLKHNCANKDLKSGKDENSQTIYNELEELKQQDPSGGGGSGGEPPQGGDDPDDPKEKEIEEEIEKQNGETRKKRQEEERERQQWDEYEYYRGPKW